jgi:hypothetical protein
MAMRIFMTFSYRPLVVCGSAHLGLEASVELAGAAVAKTLADENPA